MNFEAIKEQLQQLQSGIDKAILEIEKSNHVSFNQALIQRHAIEIFQLAEKISNMREQNNVTEKKELETSFKNHLPEEEEKKEIANQEEQIKATETVVDETSKPLAKQEPEPIIQTEIKAKPLEKQAHINAAKVDTQVTKDEELSLNEKVSKNKQAVLNYAEKSKETPITEISKAISISKKFEFINGLFGGKGEVYKACLATLENFQTYEEASLFLENSIMSEYSWDENENLASEFFALMRRRFNN